MRSEPSFNFSWATLLQCIDMSFQPSEEILKKYANVLVNFALNSGLGLKSGEVVYLQAPTSALPLYRALYREIIRAGGIIVSGLSDNISGTDRFFFEHATDKQLTSFLPNYYKGLVDDIDHRIALLSEHDVHELDGIDPRKIMVRQKSMKLLRDWFSDKEQRGKHTWTLALYGTESMAKEAGLSINDYWGQIIKAVYLDKASPVAHWRRINDEVQRISNKLTSLQITKVHMQGEDVDLHVSIGENRRWLGGTGRNIPSFEVFTSPDWRGVDGWIRFNQPLYRYGPVIKGVELFFKNGRVVNAKSKTNENLLKEMIAVDNGAARIGEYSLTDRRLSRITKFMAETLFDENMGGKYGNTHIALGASFPETYKNAGKIISKKKLGSLGFNDSAVHTDIVSTTDRTVTATLPGGEQQIIYKSGQFTI